MKTLALLSFLAFLIWFNVSFAQIGWWMALAVVIATLF